MFCSKHAGSRTTSAEKRKLRYVKSAICFRLAGQLLGRKLVSARNKNFPPF